MLWALLFTLIFSGPESGMINAKFKKHVKKYVVEKERKDQILILVKFFEKESKALRKKEKKSMTQLAELNTSKTTTTEQFQEFFNQVMIDRTKMNDIKLETRMKVQQLIEPSEWDQIVTASKAYWNKNEKKRAKQISKLKKSFLKTELKIEKTITDPHRQQKALAIVRQFKDEVVRIEKAIDDVNINNKTAMGNLNATESEIAEMIKQIYDLQWQLFENYKTNHLQLVEITTDQEWDKIVKSLNKIF